MLVNAIRLFISLVLILVVAFVGAKVLSGAFGAPPRDSTEPPDDTQSENESEANGE